MIDIKHDHVKVVQNVDLYQGRVRLNVELILE